MSNDNYSKKDELINKLANSDRIYGDYLTEYIYEPSVKDELNKIYMETGINSFTKYKYYNLEEILKGLWRNNNSYKSGSLSELLEGLLKNNCNLSSVRCMPERDEIILLGSFNLPNGKI